MDIIGTMEKQLAQNKERGIESQDVTYWRVCYRLPNHPPLYLVPPRFPLVRPVTLVKVHQGEP